MVPTVTTVPSVGDVSRLTSGWSATITAAAATTGSAVRCGIAPCPPRPLIVRKNVSAAAIIVPGCDSQVHVSRCQEATERPPLKSKRWCSMRNMHVNLAAQSRQAVMLAMAPVGYIQRVRVSQRMATLHSQTATRTLLRRNTQSSPG